MMKRVSRNAIVSTITCIEMVSREDCLESQDEKVLDRKGYASLELLTIVLSR
jgi:hypothetical protein